MSKRVVLLTAVPLLALSLVTGCANGSPVTSADGSGGGSEASAPSDRSTAGDDRGDAAGSGAADPTSDPGDGPGDPGDGPGDPGDATGDPGDGDMLAGQGDQADFPRMVAPCPDGQAVEIQKVITADVTGDGTHDALVARTCEAVTSYWPSTVEIFDGASSSSEPRRVGTLLQDVGATDEPYLRSMRVTGRSVTITAYGVDEHTRKSCPSIAFTYTYRIGDDSIERTARDVGNANTCPRIG